VVWNDSSPESTWLTKEKWEMYCQGRAARKIGLTTAEATALHSRVAQYIHVDVS